MQGPSLPVLCLTGKMCCMHIKPVVPSGDYLSETHKQQHTYDDDDDDDDDDISWCQTYLLLYDTFDPIAKTDLAKIFFVSGMHE